MLVVKLMSPKPFMYYVDIIFFHHNIGPFVIILVCF